MSKLQQAPMTNREEIEKWFSNLSDEDKVEVVRDLLRISVELDSFLDQCSIPGIFIADASKKVRDSIAINLILSSFELDSLEYLSEGSAKLLPRTQAGLSESSSESESDDPSFQSSVFSKPECIFEYCPTPEICRVNGCKRESNGHD